MPNLTTKYYFIQNTSKGTTLAIRNDELIEEKLDERRIMLEQLWEWDEERYDQYFKLRNVRTGKVLAATEFSQMDVEGNFRKLH